MKEDSIYKVAVELAETNELAEKICRATRCYKCEYKDYGIDYCIFGLQANIIKGRKQKWKTKK